MRNAYLALVADALQAMQEQFTPQHSFFCTNEEKSFFLEHAPKAPIPKAVAAIEKIQPKEAVPALKHEVKSESKPQAPQIKEEKTSVTTTAQKPSKGPALPTKDWKEISQKVAPNWPLRDDIPSDEEATRNAELWKDPKIARVIILSFSETEEELALLKNISKAIDLYLAPAKIINASRFEEENKWEGFFKRKGAELIIASPTLHQTKNLRSFYKEIPSTHQLFLAEIPLFVLKSLKEYTKDPLAKKMLWQSLCQLLKK